MSRIDNRYEWQKKKLLVRRRAGGMCERCRQRKGEHVHHLKYAPRRGTEPLEWLQLVCLECHGHYHPHHTFRPAEDQRRIAFERSRKAVRTRRAPKSLPETPPLKDRF